MVVVLARITVKPNERERFLELVKGVSAPSRAEAGCLAYRGYFDAEQPDEFIFVERWESVDALREHFGMAHFGEFAAALPDVIEGEPDVQVYDVASTVDMVAVEAAAGADA
jgi:quinol monooxygenase YgiN